MLLRRLLFAFRVRRMARVLVSLDEAAARRLYEL